ncbi:MULTISPECIES: hypothetical protein [unclassified Micromonospora]|uniref:hypothetical protein n=1 Tax=unclassified Micromonospora TaxID=2617518 RepID=UPI0033A5280A
MDAAADDRLRSAALVGVALAALAVGGWWWRAAAPAATAQPAPTPTVRPDEIGPGSGTPSGVPDVRRTVQLDSETSVIAREGETSSVWIDPETGRITDLDGPADEFVSQGDPADGLPGFSATIWRERATLTPGKSVIREASGDGGRYLLQYRCTRPGGMLVVVTGARLTGPSRIDCDGALNMADVDAIGGPIRVSLSTAGEEPVDVEAQFVELS